MGNINGVAGQHADGSGGCCSGRDGESDELRQTKKDLVATLLQDSEERVATSRRKSSLDGAWSKWGSSGKGGSNRSIRTPMRPKRWTPRKSTDDKIRARVRTISSGSSDRIRTTADTTAGSTGSSRSLEQAVAGVAEAGGPREAMKSLGRAAAELAEAMKTTANLAMDLDFESTMQKKDAFVEGFKADMASSLGIPADKVQIENLVAGSVKVAFALTNGPDGAGALDSFVQGGEMPAFSNLSKGLGVEVKAKGGFTVTKRSDPAAVAAANAKLADIDAQLGQQPLLGKKDDAAGKGEDEEEEEEAELRSPSKSLTDQLAGMRAKSKDRVRRRSVTNLQSMLREAAAVPDNRSSDKDVSVPIDHRGSLLSTLAATSALLAPTAAADDTAADDDDGEDGVSEQTGTRIPPSSGERATEKDEQDEQVENCRF